MAQLVSGDARFGLYLDYAPITLDQSCKGLQTIELKQLPNLYLLAHEQHPIWKSGNLSTELHRYPNLGEQLALGNTCTQPCLERLATLESNLQDAQHLCLVPIVTLNLVCELMPSLNAETLSVRHTMNYYRHRAVPKLFAIGQPEQLKRLQSPLIDTINYMI
ncbi:hypothetical protein GCM10007895_07420 [Paraferrimonas sedimenticola]|uniref:Uncharacterized protein n=2 Tax=Paraferrimonas sedimenticola TaxID=375674 RepID=A0AA37RUK1_9GAMM|nr:hypothetical protein GCM10007895_07420 [Paraferrimonas sedimenticola]